MASYNPPNEYITQFNTSLFNQPEDTLSQAEANQLYLSKSKSDISNSPSTTFNGQVSFNNEAPISNTTPSIPTHLATLAYLTSFYQPITSMSSYLLISVAASTYQTIANMTNYVSRTGSITEDITGTKTFTGTIKSNSYDTNTATTALNIGASVTSGDINIGRNKSSGSIYIGSSSGLGQVTINCMTSLQSASIANGQYLEVRNIQSADPSSTLHKLFDNMTTNGVLTIGNALSSNTINGASTFNQAVSVTGLLTANGDLKTNSIVPLVGSGQNNIYTALPTSGTIFFGTASRTMNIYGVVNMVNSCQFSNALQTNDITHIGTQSNTAKNIYTTLTAGGVINLGNATASTTTNVTGGALNLGSTNFNTNINSTTTNFTSNGALTIGASVAPASFSFFSSLLNTTINFFSGLTSGTINFCSSTTMNTMFNLNARVKLRTYKLVDELQTLTLTSHTLGFPLQQTTIFTNTANVSVTLPEITNDAQLGLRFTFVNLGSITTTTTFVRQGTNLIIPVGQMGQFTSSAIINNTKTICNLVIVKLEGIYIWTEYTF